MTGRSSYVTLARNASPLSCQNWVRKTLFQDVVSYIRLGVRVMVVRKRVSRMALRCGPLGVRCRPS